MLKKLPLVLSILTVPSLAFAVIHSKTTTTFRAVIKLENSNKDICTGTVVGLNPPTVITARHCTQTSTFGYHGIGPYKVVTEAFGHHGFIPQSAKLPGDMAVLVFPKSSVSEFRKDMSEKDLFEIGSVENKTWETVEVCGYGGTDQRGHVYTGIGVQRCGVSTLILDDQKFNYRSEYDRVDTMNPGVPFQDLYGSMKAKFTYSYIQIYLNEYGKGTRLGLGALLEDSGFPYGQYDDEGKRSLTHLGDSGGPVFIRKDGRKILLAVTSGMLGARTGQGESLNVGAFSWRLDHQWSKDLLRKAFSEGADLKP